MIAKRPSRPADGSPARALDDHTLNRNAARIAGPISRINSRKLLYRFHSALTSTVCPMDGPFPFGQASLRLGGVFPHKYGTGSNIGHLLFLLAKSDLAASD